MDKIMDQAHKLKEEIWAYLDSKAVTHQPLKDQMNELLDTLDEIYEVMG